SRRQSGGGVLAGNEQGKPAAAPAGERGAGELAEDPDGLSAEGRQGQADERAGAADGVEDVHRRHAGHYVGRDAREGEAAEAAGGPAGFDSGRLPAADDGRECERQARLREPHAGGELDLARAEGAGEGDARAGGGALAAFARQRAEDRRQEAAA